VSGPRRAGFGLGLVALAAVAGLLVGWLTDPPVPSPFSSPVAATPPAPTAPPAAPTVTRREAEAVPSPASPPPAADLEAPAPRACPDVGAAIAELAALLERTDLQVVQVFDPRVELWGGGLDGHCTALVAAQADDSTVSAASRLAALSLLRVVPELPGGFALSPDARALLWRAFDRGLASPVAAVDAIERPGATAAHRDSIARVAGACLAVLGDAADLDRLLDRMVAEPDLVATRSLAYARPPQVAEALVGRLADAERGTPVLVALVGMLDDRRGPDLDPVLADGVAQAVAERWRGQEPGANEELLCAIVLGRLDPQLEARLWRERLDADGVTPERVARAALALARSASAEDLARLEAWLAAGSDAERVEAAVALVRLGPEGDSSVLRTRALDALESVVRTAEAPAMRREALYSLAPDPARMVPLAGEVLRLDPDEGVRLAAVGRLGRHAGTDPRARELLEWAAAGDGSESVRSAAARALR
jgi:hypothetical protein